MEATESGIIHLYSIVENTQLMDFIKTIHDVANDAGRRINITNIRDVHNYSPSQHMMAFDISLNDRKPY